MASKNRNKWIALLTVGIGGVYFLVSFAAYRLTADGEPENFEGRVVYKLKEDAAPNRRFFEGLMGNLPVRLDDGSVWYVSKRDHKILWPRHPDEMVEKGYTINTVLKAQKLYFGGYAHAEVYEMEILNEQPTVIK